MPTANKHTTTTRRAAQRTRAKSGKDDAIKLLKADHKDVSELLEKYENGRLSKDRKMAVAKQICLALTVHAQIEEEIFYRPRARPPSATARICSTKRKSSTARSRSWWPRSRTARPSVTNYSTRA